MGIFESVSRSEHNINGIADWLRQAREQKRRQEMYENVRKIMQPREELTPEAQSSISDVQDASQREIPTSPRNYGGGSTIQRPQTQMVTPDLNSPDVLLDIGKMAGADPFALYQMAARSQQSERERARQERERLRQEQEKKNAPFTLNRGAKKYDAKGNMIAENPYESGSDQPSMKTANPDDYYWDGTSWKKIDPNYKPQPSASDANAGLQREKFEEEKRQRLQKLIDEKKAKYNELSLNYQLYTKDESTMENRGLIGEVATQMGLLEKEIPELEAQLGRSNKPRQQPQYTKTAVNPKTGERLGLNPSTGQWEPIK